MREIKSGSKLNGKILTRQSIAGDNLERTRYQRNNTLREKAGNAQHSFVLSKELIMLTKNARVNDVIIE